jgi:hypothetical protein
MEQIKLYLKKLIAENKVKEVMFFLSENVSEKSPFFKMVVSMTKKYYDLTDLKMSHLVPEPFAQKEEKTMVNRLVTVVERIEMTDLNPRIKLRVRYKEEDFRNSKAANIEEWLRLIAA